VSPSGEDLPDRDEDREYDDEDDLGSEPVVSIDISGLSIYTHHGVGEAEREVGQRLVFDVSFELERCDATVTDDLDDTVDYGDVCQQVALAAQERSFDTLERLCSHVADRMLERYGVEEVTVRAAKPEPPIPLPVAEVAVEVFKERAG
jgi:7,8-dihydroneopterin aldolase/epimerase/oxygenase